MRGIKMEQYGQLSPSEFAARMRAARGYAGWTLAEAGERLCVSRQVLSKRERGEARQSIADRFLVATVYCEESGLPESFFTEQDWKKVV
jgi:transcriptional regulator with XRE-family HTH domain